MTELPSKNELFKIATNLIQNNTPFVCWSEKSTYYFTSGNNVVNFIDIICHGMDNTALLHLMAPDYPIASEIFVTCIRDIRDNISDHYDKIVILIHNRNGVKPDILQLALERTYKVENETINIPENVSVVLSSPIESNLLLDNLSLDNLSCLDLRHLTLSSKIRDTII